LHLAGTRKMRTVGWPRLRLLLISTGGVSALNRDLLQSVRRC
jgi:hypothetical protein